MRLELLCHDTPNGAEVSFGEVIEALIAHNFKAQGHDIHVHQAKKMVRRLSKELGGDDNEDELGAGGAEDGGGGGGGRVAALATLAASRAAPKKVADTKAWASLRHMSSQKLEVQRQESHDAGTIARHFALEIISSHLGDFVKETQERLKRKRAQRTGRRNSFRCNATSDTTEAVTKAEAIATAIYDNVLARDGATALPPAARLPPPGMVSPPERQARTRLPAMLPPSPEERERMSRSTSPERASWGSVRKAYDRHLNPTGWPSIGEVKAGAARASYDA